MNDSIKKVSSSILKFKSIPALSLEMFFRFYMLSWSVAIFFGFLINSYYGKVNSLIWSFIVADGFTICDPKTQGIGAHCFSDFYKTQNAAVLSTPWAHGEIAYPPFPLFLLKILAKLGDVTSDRLVIFSFLGLIVAFTIFPIWHLAFRRKYVSKTTFWFLLPIVLLTPGFLLTLDRGNTIGLIIPFVYLLVLAIFEKRSFATGINILIILELKQQFALLLLIILVAYGLREFIKWSAISTFAFALSFLLYPHPIITNFLQFVNGARNFGQQGSIMHGSLNRVNISFPNNIALIANYFGINSIPLIFFYSFYLVIILLIVIFHRKLTNNISVYMLLLLLPIMAPAVTFAYYYITLIPFILILCAGLFETKFRENNLFKIVHKQFFGTRILSYISTILLVCIMVPMPVPLSVFKFIVPAFADGMI